MPLDHERLIVYQRSLEFISWAGLLIDEANPKGDVRNQLDRASTSIPLNIAEGNGRFSIPERCRFLGFAYGSALESSACLDVIVAKRSAEPDRIADGKSLLEEIVNRLVRLRESLRDRETAGDSSYRVKEGGENEWVSLTELEVST